MVDELRVPLYYQVKSGLSEDELGTVQHALRITPVCCTVITDPRDCDQAIALGQEVVRVASPAAAHRLARSLNQPCVVIAGSEIFSPVFEDVDEAI
jgi:hypothetical protein